MFSDSGSVTLRLALKDIGTMANPTTPIDEQRGHDQPLSRDASAAPTGGTRRASTCPYPFDGAVTGTIASGGTLTLGFELVRHVAKEESPLVQLVDSPTIISTIADVTFYGQDVVGNEISVMGSISVDFGNFGD